jgi:hypothetical protein
MLVLRRESAFFRTFLPVVVIDNFVALQTLSSVLVLN